MRFLRELSAKRVRFLFVILLVTFCQHLVVNPVLDTKCKYIILFSFDTNLLLNIVFGLPFVKRLPSAIGPLSCLSVLCVRL